jgi:predicted kinase
MPKAYILVGIPGSGKSTWIKNQTWALGLTVVSTDAFVEDYARAQGKTYSDVFEDYMPEAVDLMIQQVVRAREHNHDIIWDQTSVTVASRIKKFNMLPDYEHIAVVFPIPGKEELARRLNSRPGKTIPDNVIQQMIDSFEMPTTEEGFTTVIRVGRKNGPQETN